MRTKSGWLYLASAIGLLAAACALAPAATQTSGQASPSQTGPTTATRPASPSPTVRPTTAALPRATERAPLSNVAPGSSIVTFRVVEEEYRILLTDPADIVIAELLLAGDEAPSIPSGLIIRGETGVNVGWSWSIDPESVEFADVTTEVCDGLPSHVEDGTLEGDRYCPWSAEVVDIVPADSPK